MVKVINLSHQIERQLPPDLIGFMKTAGEVVSAQGKGFYLVGGVVRDLLLGRPNYDLDLVVEGDAIELAKKVVEINGGRLVTYLRFNTAKIRWDSRSVDFATARSETYAKPGALPKVKPGLIKDDLFRRDFTINAMAVYLSAGRYGELVDLYGGMADLEHKLIRILHDRSFIDDATRIWRAIRYEQRLGFQIEPHTLELLKRDIDMLDNVSGDRIRHELELVLKEEKPEKALRRAGELGVLAKLHPALKDNGWLAEKFQQAREITSTASTPALYMSLLTYPLKSAEIEQIISYLRFPKPVTRVIRDTAAVKGKLEYLSDSELPRSRVHHLLYGYSPLAITANLLATDSAVVHHNLQLFLDKLRYIKTALTGNDINKMGVSAGPRLKEILGMLLDARLDGKVTSRQGELELVRKLITPPF